MTDISKSFYLQDAGKKSTGIYMEQNYVTVTSCIGFCSRIISTFLNILSSLPTYLAEKVMRSVVTVCPTVFILSFKPPDLRPRVCVMAAALRGLKIEVIGNRSRSVERWAGGSTGPQIVARPQI